jgi:hypothetical protein
MPLSIRIDECEAYDTVLHRDHNASRTIEGLGRQARASVARPRLVDVGSRHSCIYELSIMVRGR